jgi:hypothetical protein
MLITKIDSDPPFVVAKQASTLKKRHINSQKTLKASMEFGDKVPNNHWQQTSAPDIHSFVAHGVG